MAGSYICRRISILAPGLVVCYSLFATRSPYCDIENDIHLDCGGIFWKCGVSLAVAIIGRSAARG